MYEHVGTSRCKLSSGTYATVQSPGPTKYGYQKLYGLKVVDKVYTFDILFVNFSSTDFFQTGDPNLPIFDFLNLSVTDFAAAQHEFQRLTAGLSSESASKSTAVSPAPSFEPKPAKLLISSDPQNALVYINGELKGTASQEGLAMGLPAGTYQLRLTLPGYREVARPITISAGENKEVVIQLERLGPPPFTVADLTELLRGGVSSKRVASGAATRS